MSNARRIADIFGGTAPTANTLQLGDSSQARLFIPGVGIDTNTLSNNQTLQWNDTTGVFAGISLGSSVTVYDSANLFPLTGNTAGDQAYASDTNHLFLFSGSGWYRIATINATPTLTTSPDASYELDSNGGTATTISLTATDSDGTPIFWSYTADDSADDLATIANDSNGTFTITAKTLSDILAAGYDSNGGSFDITFKASDNINFASATSEFTLTFISQYFFPPQDLSSATLINTGGNVIFPTTANPRGYGIDYRNNLYAVDYNNNLLYKKDISNIISEETASPSGGVNPSFSVAIPGTKTYNYYMGVCISSDGKYVFIADSSTTDAIIRRYELTTAYDISTIQSPSANTFSTSSNSGYCYYMSISEDGTILYTSAETGILRKITMTTAYDLSTASLAQDVSNGGATITAIDPTGSRTLDVFYGGPNFSTRALSTPHDLTTIGSSSSTITYPNSQPICAVYTADGNYAIIGDQLENEFHIYKLV